MVTMLWVECYKKTLGTEFWQPGLAESPYPRKREGLEVPTDIVMGISGSGIICPLTSLGSQRRGVEVGRAEGADVDLGQGLIDMQRLDLV